jgi:hypothetical protein
LEIDGNGEQLRIEYDVIQYRLIIRDMNGNVKLFASFPALGEIDKAVNELKKIGKIIKEGFYTDEEAPLIQKMYDKAEKDKKGKIEKEQNPYRRMDKEELKKRYFEIANNELPKILANGFVKAFQKYKNGKSGANEICCILDINKKSKMIFVYGDGSDCEDTSDESVFLKYPCDETLYKCKLMIEAIDTLNLGQESSHWLTDAVNLAEKQNVFKDLSVTIYGNVQYGEIELDVIYEK